MAEHVGNFIFMEAQQDETCPRRYQKGISLGAK